jgi:hypothetical protein
VEIAMRRQLLVVIATIALSACGDTSVPISDTLDGCSAGGIWRAADGTVALIDEDDRAHLVRPDGTQFVGDVIGVRYNKQDCIADREKSEMHAVLPLGVALPDGSTSGRGRVDAGWVARTGQLQLTVDVKTAVGAPYPVAFLGTYDSLHASGSSKATITGMYRSSASPEAAVLTIDPDGRMFSQDATTGCIVNGSIGPVDGHYDVYRVTLNYSACLGALVPLNGLPVKGLATYDARQNPAELVLALDVGEGTQHYSIVLLERRI